MSQQFFTIVTTVGQQRIARAAAVGTQVSLTHMAVGDGNGRAVVPDAGMTALRREVFRAPVNTLNIDPKNRNQIVAELVIPEEIGDFTIREVGLFDADRNLIAVGNLPENYKPRAASGTASQQVVRMIIQVASPGAVAIRIDPAIVLATREYVDQSKTEVVNRLTDDKTTAALSAAMGKKLQDEKLGNSGDQTISNGILTVGRAGAWPAIKIPSGTGVWEIETNPNSSAAVDGSIGMGFKFVEAGQPNKGIIMSALKEGYEHVAYQSWVREGMVALVGNQTVGGSKTFAEALTAGRAGHWDKYRMPVKNGGQWIIETDPDSNLGREASLRINIKYEQGGQSRYIHFPAPEGGNKNVAYQSWVNERLGAYTAAGSAVMLEGNQTVGGVKTFSNRADFSSGIRIGGSNTEQYSGLFRGTGDWYWSNPISGQSLQLKDNGDLAYQNRKIYHEGNKPAWADIQGKPDLATRGTTLAHYGITDSVTAADFQWASLKPGTVMYFAAEQAPHGWLAANGAAVNRSTFPHLFAAIGTRYGAGNGSTTFNLPDLRGEFVRGWDNGRNVDAGRALGSWQNDEFRSHHHIYRRGHLTNSVPWEHREANRDGNAAMYDGDGRFDDGGDRVTTSASGGVETRPRNIALLACIKV